MKDHRSSLCVVTLLAGVAQLAAQDATEPSYPRTSLSTWYQVDAGWPRRPPEMRWGDMPGIAVDEEDQVWIYTRAQPPVQVYDAAGNLVRAWGQDLVKTAHHIKLDRDGDVWLADIGHHTVFHCAPQGKLLKTLGTRGVPGCDETHLNQPTDMAVTPTGEVFVSDGYGNNRVVHFSRDGKFIKTWGKLGTGPGDFSLPHAIALDSHGKLYVADRNNARVQVFDQAGTFLAEWRNLIVPWGFWVSKTDEIWICGSSPMPWRATDSVLGCPPKDQVFMKLNTDGKILQMWTVPKGEDKHEHPGECNWVHAVAFDSKGNFYAGDIIGQRAQKFVRQN